MSQVFRVPEDQIRDGASPRTIANWDSLSHMNLIVALEEEFGVQFQEHEILQMTHFEAILANLAPKVCAS